MKPPLDVFDQTLYDVKTHAAGPAGRLPLQADWLRETPSGDVFGWTQDAAMGWSADQLGKNEFLILSTQGGIRAPDGTPIALGYHTGHWEVGLLAQAAAEELQAAWTRFPLQALSAIPCDGRTQGTPGMMDSLAYRNDAATVLRRLIRSLPTRRGVLGIATCDKGLPAMMMALAAQRSLPCVIVPGGVTLLPEQGEDAGKIQSLGARFAHGLLTLEEASELGCRACASPGGGCQFLGTAATSQVVAEALGTGRHAFRAGAFGSTDLAGYGAAFGARPDRDGSAKDHNQRYSHRRLPAQRHGDSCRVWRQHELAAAHPGHCPRRESAAPNRGGLDHGSIGQRRASWM